MKANSYVILDMTVAELAQLSLDDLRKQIAAQIKDREDWEFFADDLADREGDFVAEAVDDGLKTMDDLINMLGEDCDEEALTKFIEPNLDGSTFHGEPSNGGVSMKVRFEFDFDWEAYRNYKAGHKGE